MKSFTKQAPEAKPTLIREFESNLLRCPWAKSPRIPGSGNPGSDGGPFCPREADELGFCYFLGTVASFKSKKLTECTSKMKSLRDNKTNLHTECLVEREKKSFFGYSLY